MGKYGWWSTWSLELGQKCIVPVWGDYRVGLCWILFCSSFILFIDSLILVHEVDFPRATHHKSLSTYYFPRKPKGKQKRIDVFVLIWNKIVLMYNHVKKYNKVLFTFGQKIRNSFLANEYQNRKRFFAVVNIIKWSICMHALPLFLALITLLIFITWWFTISRVNEPLI